MATLTKRDAIAAVADKLGQPHTYVRTIVQEFMDEMERNIVDGNRIEFRDFGIFFVRERKPRTGRNPKTGTLVDVPARNAVVFKAGKRMKESMRAKENVR